MPWYIHSIRGIYHPDIRSQVEGTKYAFAVCEPYAANLIERLCAAWWVVTGRAHAFTWPKAGDIEAPTGSPLWDRAVLGAQLSIQQGKRP